MVKKDKYKLANIKSFFFRGGGGGEVGGSSKLLAFAGNIHVFIFYGFPIRS